MRKTLYQLILPMAVLALSGCAATQLTSDVSTYSQWPAERKPGSYAFERLPSQQADPANQELLENSARRALDGAGFKLATDPASAEYLVQLGARVGYGDRSFYYDPWGGWGWGGGMAYGRWGRPYGYRYGGWGYGWGYPYAYPFGYPIPTYEREVALLIRDRRNGAPLFEARATSDGTGSSIEALLPALYQAALKDFPNGGVNPRRITTELAPPQ